MRRKRILIAALAAIGMANLPVMARPETQLQRWQIHTPEFLEDNLKMALQEQFLLVQSEPRKRPDERAFAGSDDGDRDVTAEDLRRRAGELRQRVRQLRDAGRMEEAAELMREAREQMRVGADTMREKMQALRSRIDQLREEGREDEIPEVLRGLREDSRELGRGSMRAREARQRERARGERPSRPDAASEDQRREPRRRRTANDDPARQPPVREDAERDETSANRERGERRDPQRPDARPRRGNPAPMWRPGDPVGGRGPAARARANQRGPGFARGPRQGGRGYAWGDDSGPGPRAAAARRDDRPRGPGPEYAGPGPGGRRPDVRGDDGFCRRCRRALNGPRGPGRNRQMRGGGRTPGLDGFARGPRPKVEDGLARRAPVRPPRPDGDRMSRAPRVAQIMMAARLLRAAGLPDMAERVTRLARDKPPRGPLGFPERDFGPGDFRHARQGEPRMRESVADVQTQLQLLHEQLRSTHRELRALRERLDRLERRMADDDD